MRVRVLLFVCECMLSCTLVMGVRALVLVCVIVCEFVWLCFDRYPCDSTYVCVHAFVRSGMCVRVWVPACLCKLCVCMSLRLCLGGYGCACVRVG